MAIHGNGSDFNPVRGSGGVKVSDLGSDYRLVQDGVEQLAHGALVCPDCSMPVRIEEPIGAGAPLECGFCDESAPAREFLVRDVYDTPRNEVLLIARIEH